MRNDFFKYLLIHGRNKSVESETLPMTFKAKRTENLKNYRIYGNTVNGESVGELVTDSQSSNYGKYKIPVTLTANTAETTDIYLDKPLKKVGDEAEYVDYATQKWHRVRKNLLQNTATSQTRDGVTFTVNSDGSTTCNGTAINNVYYQIAINVTKGSFIVTGCPLNGNMSTYLGQIRYRQPHDGSYTPPFPSVDSGTGVQLVIDDNEENTYLYQIRITSGYTCDNLTFYPMIRKVSVTDDTYEPYIENTEVDVTLPEIAVTTGTNTLTVGTEVQPSKVYLQGHISEVEENENAE